MQVNFTVVAGSGALSSASAADEFHWIRHSHTRRHAISALGAGECVRRSHECALRPFYANPVSARNRHLQPVAGAGQISTGQAFQPVVVRVTDLSSPPNPVIAAPVVFLTTVLRPGGTSSGSGGGD